MALLPDPIVDVDRDTGELISGWPRCKKSIITILTTRLNTRLMRLWWGSDFLGVQDKPNNAQTFNESISAALNAIDELEPEFKVARVILAGNSVAGEGEVIIEGEYKLDKIPRKIKVNF